MYFVRTGGYLKCFKGYFKTRKEAAEKIKSILQASRKENAKSESPLSYNYYNIDASISLFKINANSLPVAKAFFLPSPLRAIPKYKKSAYKAKKCST